MKTSRFKLSIIILGVAVITIGGIVYAAGLPSTPGRTIIQNLQGLADTGTRSDTVTGTKQVFKIYSAAGYTGIEGAVVDASGNPVIVKWSEDNNLVWIGSTFKATNNGAQAFQTVSYQPYSTASRKLTSVIRRQ